MLFDLLTFVASDKAEPNKPDDRVGERAFAEMLKKAGTESQSSDWYKSVIAQILVDTTSHDVRNAAALTLVDLDARDAVDALVHVIKRPDLAKHNGTLIFALDELGGSIPLSVVVQIVAQGSYEATAETLLIVEDKRINIPSDHEANEACRQALFELKMSENPDISEAATVVLAHIA